MAWAWRPISVCGFKTPTIGCAKTLFVGKFDEPAPERGARSDLVYRGEIVGAALRTKTRVSPVFVSPGNLIDLDTSIQILLACDGGYRIPEPTRRAHLFVNRLRHEGGTQSNP